MDSISTSIVHHPLAYQFGRLQFTGFGLAVLLAFVISQIIAERELARRGHDPRPIGDLIFAAVVGTLIGAKLYYAILTQDLGSLLSRAGFVFWGGLLGGIAVTAIVIRKKRLRFTRISDVAGICLAAGYSVGRTGCWAVGDDYGRPWQSRFAVSFPDGAPPSTVENLRDLFGMRLPADLPPNTVLSVYPTQLYEVAMGFIMFLILWRNRDHRHAEGWLFGLYCVLAGIERFIVEFFRAKDDRLIGPLTVAQVIAVGFVLFGSVWMQMRREVNERQPGIHALART